VESVTGKGKGNQRKATGCKHGTERKKNFGLKARKVNPGNPQQTLGGATKTTERRGKKAVKYGGWGKKKENIKLLTRMKKESVGHRAQYAPGKKKTLGTSPGKGPP